MVGGLSLTLSTLTVTEAGSVVVKVPSEAWIVIVCMEALP